MKKMVSQATPGFKLYTILKANAAAADKYFPAFARCTVSLSSAQRLIHCSSHQYSSQGDYIRCSLVRKWRCLRRRNMKLKRKMFLSTERFRDRKRETCQNRHQYGKRARTNVQFLKQALLAQALLFMVKKCPPP
jgi:hypothetical protein